jgi:hypothetical protein
MIGGHRVQRNVRVETNDKEMVGQLFGEPSQFKAFSASTMAGQHRAIRLRLFETGEQPLFQQTQSAVGRIACRAIKVKSFGVSLPD